MNTLGSRLRLLREELKLKQVEVAAAVGLSRSHLTQVERDKYGPGREMLMALASFYGVSLDWLTTGHGEMRPESAAARNQSEALLLFAYRQLPEDEAKPLLEMLLSRVRPKGS